MKKYPFSLQDIEMKIKDRYSLKESDLFETAEAIRRDFGYWMRQNIDLSSSQKKYFNMFDVHFVEYLSASLSLIVINRILLLIKWPAEVSQGDVCRIVDLEIAISTVISKNGDQRDEGRAVVGMSCQ